MKRILFTIIATVATLNVYAQPRALGIRLGATGLEADYLHTMNRNQFIEGNLGLDFGFGANGVPGVKATATYNFIWARPAWTNKGTWALYAGPGATLGYVNDEVHYKGPDGKNVINFFDNGFMLGLCGQVGLEYSFDFPLLLAVDMRPCIGLHVNTGKGARVGFYDNGLLGLVPNLSVRYRF